MKDDSHVLLCAVFCLLYFDIYQSLMSFLGQFIFVLVLNSPSLYIWILHPIYKLFMLPNRKQHTDTSETSEHLGIDTYNKQINNTIQ